MIPRSAPYPIIEYDFPEPLKKEERRGLDRPSQMWSGRTDSSRLSIWYVVLTAFQQARHQQMPSKGHVSRTKLTCKDTYMKAMTTEMSASSVKTNQLFPRLPSLQLPQPAINSRRSQLTSVVTLKRMIQQLNTHVIEQRLLTRITRFILRTRRPIRVIEREVLRLLLDGFGGGVDVLGRICTS